MTRTLAVALTIAAGAASTPAHAATVAWVDWTSSDSASVYGTLVVDSATVAVTYTGERGFVQTTCGTNYWAAGAANPYTSAIVDNPPDGTPDNDRRCDIIALSQATAKTLSFSEPVTNPLFAVVSLNGNGYRFDRDFDILGFGPGYWGNGTLTKQVTMNPDGSVTYDLIGSGEPHGVIQFIGTFQTVSWTSLSNEFWNGFSIAVEHLAAAVPPEIEVSARGAPITSGQLAPIDFGVLDVGTSTIVELTVANTGTGPLNISNIELTGSGAARFEVGPFPPAIAASASVVVTLTFTASTTAASTATVTIHNDDGDEATFDFPVRGRARVDTDSDGRLDAEDNCPDVANPEQLDLDGDTIGDACDDDADGDGRELASDCDDLDATIFELVTFFGDNDGDGRGDPTDAIEVCSATPPAGYVSDGTDNCPGASNVDQLDLDGDGMGDACDEDADGDQVLDSEDNCPRVENPDQSDTDGNGTGDTCEDDLDGDLIADDLDNCPMIANANQTDTDQDGAGDACDPPDVDGDGIPDAADNCPAAANADQADADGDGAGTACDADEMTPPIAEDDMEAGCGCGTQRAGGASAEHLAALLALALVLRRRARYLAACSR